MSKIILWLLIGTTCIVCPTDRVAAQQPTESQPLLRVVDLNVGESQSVQLCDGREVSVKLLDLQQRRDPFRQAVREARVTVSVDGQTAELTSATYHLPTRVGDVQIDCSITQGYNSNGSPESWRSTRTLGFVYGLPIRLYCEREHSCIRSSNAGSPV